VLAEQVSCHALKALELEHARLAGIQISLPLATALLARCDLSLIGRAHLVPVARAVSKGHAAKLTTASEGQAATPQKERRSSLH